VSQLWILGGERSGLLKRTAMTESLSITFDSLIVNPDHAWCERLLQQDQGRCSLSNAAVGEV